VPTVTSVAANVAAKAGNTVTVTVPDVPVIKEVAVSVAVTVWLPAVFKVTLKLPAPLVSIASAGKVAAASLEVSATVGVALVITFQFASTALTVTVKTVPAVCAAGVPVLPVVVPGAAVSPGSRICSFVATGGPIAIKPGVFKPVAKVETAPPGVTSKISSFPALAT